MSEHAALLLELGLLLLVLGGVGALAWRIGISAVPMFLLAGLAFGEGGVFAAETVGDFLATSAEIGVVLLLLSLGLEFSADEFAAALRRHTPSGVVDFVLNATPGFVAGALLGLPWQGSMAMAGVTWISSSGIVSRTLRDLGRLGNRETPSVLSILVLEDIAMAVFLPLLSVFLIGGGPGAAARGVALAMGVVLLVLWLSRRLAPQLTAFLSHTNDEQVMLRLLGLTLLVAGIAEAVGASAAVGAFLVGLAAPPEAAARIRPILRPLRDLFGAIFFLHFGYDIDPSLILPVLPAALGLAVVTALTKLVTGWYAAGRDGVGVRGRVRAGTALVSRGEFSVVIAGLAVTAGIGDIGPLATSYVLVLAVAGPIMTRYAAEVARPVERVLLR
jgi:CPA2 family monovalent cation:H+ antiporter-2